MSSWVIFSLIAFRYKGSNGGKKAESGHTGGLGRCRISCPPAASPLPDPLPDCVKFWRVWANMAVGGPNWATVQQILGLAPPGLRQISNPFNESCIRGLRQNKGICTRPQSQGTFSEDETKQRALKLAPVGGNAFANSSAEMLSPIQN